MEDLEDFSYLLKFPGREPLHVRELTPKDFYLAQILRNRGEGNFPLIERLILSKETFLSLSCSEFRATISWAISNLLEEQIFSVEDWLEVAFHLSKQRWGDSIDWLEKQPVSKVRAMIQVVEKFAEEQEEQMKKAGRR